MRAAGSGEPGAVELLEEAVHLLRSAPPRLFGLLAAGLLPFALGLMWFIAEMSWSAFAEERLLETSLLLSVLFCWKQVWEAVFCASMHELLTGAREPWTPGRLLRVAGVQLAIQPIALVALPLAALTVVPFPLTLAFFRNLSLYAGFGSDHAIRLARSQAIAGLRQNWMLQALLFVLSLLIAANYLAGGFVLPQMAKSWFGIENDITRYPMWLLTSTGMSALAVLTYVTLEPLLCAVYVVRCFHGQSVQTGADVRAKLRRLTAPAAVAVIFAALCGTPAASAQERTAAPAAVWGVDANQVDRSIDRVMRRNEYSWRMPRTDAPDQNRPGWATWLDRVFARMGEFWDWFVEGVRKLFEADGGAARKSGENDVWATTLRYSLWFLGAVFAAAAALFLYRLRKAKPDAGAVAAQAASASPDLRDESVTADQLPEGSWLELAQQWIDKGDLRLALRAMHLAGLSYLNGRKMVSVQRWKTGMEYAEEVRRRTRPDPVIAAAFRRNVQLFDSGWYGMRGVTREALEAYARGLEEVRKHADRL